MKSFIVGACLFVLACGQESKVVSTKTVDSVELPKATSEVKTKTKKLSVLSPNPKRTVYIVGEIGENILPIAAKITELGAASVEPIYLILTSPGGSVLAGGQVIAAMEASKAPVYTVCNIECASMAAMIFEYGSKRFVGDRTFLMFHPATAGAQGELDKMISRLGSMQRYIGKMEAYVAKKASLTFEQYKAKASIEQWIDGEDAVNTGFADELATLLLPANSPLNNFSGKSGTVFIPSTIEIPSMVPFKW